MRLHHLLFVFCLMGGSIDGFSQLKAEEASLKEINTESSVSQQTTQATRPKIIYGTASYYADKFNGRKTATGHIYSHEKLTAACNVLPLGTWVRVTNLRNNHAVIVQINDRLHPKNKRVVDLSKMAASRLGYVKRGLTQVKVEVLGKAKPKA
jgi:rare lipoprotein A